MSASTNDPSKGTMFDTVVSGDTVSDQVRRQQEEAAISQFNEEVASFRREVFGNDGEPKPPTEAEVGPAMAKYALEMSMSNDRMIVHMVKIMRGIAIQGQTVGANAVKAAGMANAAWDCSQKHLEAWGAQQLALHRCLHNIREAMRALAAGESVPPEELVDSMDILSASMEDAEAMSVAMQEAEERLISRAQAESELTGMPVRTGETFADDITARTVRQHGGAIAAEVTGQSRIQIAQPGTKLPSWSRKTRGRGN